MREILFRGKRIDNGEWHYGSLVSSYDENDAAIFQPDDESEIGFDVQYVLPETVGQFTGLKDDCNNKIFEGDILTYNTMRFVVVFHEYSFRMKRMNGKGVIIPLPPTDRFFTIIGNIHDNPELSLTPKS